MSMSDSAAERSELVIPIRPKRALNTFALLRTGVRNTLEACDEELFEELILERRYLWYHSIIVSDPEGIRRVLQEHYENYPRLDQSRRIFRFDSGSGLVAADERTWIRHRRMLNPVLDHRAALSEVPALIDLGYGLIEGLEQRLSESDFDVCDLATIWTTSSTRYVFAGQDRTIEPMLQTMGVYPGRFSLLDFIPIPKWLHSVDRLRRARIRPSSFYSVIDRLIAARQRDDYAGPRDVLWKLAHAKDRTTGEALNSGELRDEVLTLGSTAATPIRPLSWIWYLLAKHPWAEKRLHEELDDVLAGNRLTPENINKLVFLRRVIDETMRLYPPLPSMFRVARSDDVLCGRQVRRGSIIAIVPWALHRHRRLWENPEIFDPDRFSPERSVGRSRYAYIPFSVGPHVCIGASLAMIQILIGAAVLASRFRLRLLPEHPVVPTAWTNLRPAQGIRCYLEKR